MKSIDEIYGSVEKNLENFEKRRLEIKELGSKIPFLTLPTVIFGVMSFVSGNIFMIVLTIASIPFLVKGIKKIMEISKLKNKYIVDYKKEVVETVIKNFDETYEYTPNSGIGRNEYMESKLFTTRPDRYSCEDLVEGKYGDRAFKFSEIHSEYKTETRDKDGHRHVQWHTIFRGVFFKGEFSKKFDGYTLIFPDTAEKLFGMFGKSLQKLSFKGKLISLEDPEFEKEFAVYSNDEVESRYILSTSLMRRILDYKVNSGKKIHIAFVNENIYVAISNYKDLFEPNFNKPATDRAEIENYYNDLKVVLDIIDEFNLNQKVFKS